MRARRLILSLWFAATLCAADTDVAASLRHIATELNDAVRRCNAHLDREISQYDRASRTSAGRRIPGADLDLMGGPTDTVQIAMRKLFEARVIATRRPGYEPPSLADCERIQALIVEARAQIEIGSATLRRLQVVSAADLNPRTQAEQKLRLRELLKARNAVEEAAKRAFVALPVALPSADSSDEQRERAWDLMVAKMPINRGGPSDVKTPSPANPILPIHFEQGRRITLVNEHSCRVTLTDSGMEDTQGRRLFYQEEWIARQSVVILFRWAVAVNTKTGQHTLLRSYGPREFRGTLDELYERQPSAYTASNPKPVPPSMPELNRAIAALERSRNELSRALRNYRSQIENTFAQSQACDPDLPQDLRANLFTIRARMAHVAAFVDAEANVRNAADRASDNDRLLEALVAWVNGDAIVRDIPESESRALQEALARSDFGIRETRALEREALAALPPDLSESEAQFPALRKDFIVRMTRANGALRQEVWTVAASAGPREAKRTTVFIDIDPGSGTQTPKAKDVKRYRLDPGETLEEAYEEYASLNPPESL